MEMKIQFKRFFSVDSPKAIKAEKFRYLNAINYMAPHKSGGTGNLCPHASPGCIALCLGRESGQASMVSAATNWTNSVRDSRERKARYFMQQRQEYMVEMLHHIAAACRTARRKRIKLAVRPNGSTDIAYEGLRVMIMPSLAAELSEVSGHTVTAGAHTIFSAFPNVQFIDYTKNPRRFERPLPANYSPRFPAPRQTRPMPLKFSIAATMSQSYSLAICRKPGTATASLTATNTIFATSTQRASWSD
jgi:hypothetical protein